MIRNYILIAQNGNPLRDSDGRILGPFTLVKAETARDTLAAMGKSVHVINLKAE